MHPLVCRLSALTCLALGSLVTPAQAGRADLPSPANSTLPSVVMLVGHQAGVPDPAGEFVVVSRDAANNPIVGAKIVCDFSNTPDVRFAVQQPFAGLGVDCGSRTVWAFTDATGTARFCIVGGANNPGGAPAAGYHSVRILADGVPIGSVSATTPDENGFDGVNANDLSAWVTDYFTQQMPVRSDYDANGVLGANDASIWVGRFLAATSIQGAASLPGGVCP